MVRNNKAPVGVLFFIGCGILMMSANLPVLAENVPPTASTTTVTAPPVASSTSAVAVPPTVSTAAATTQPTTPPPAAAAPSGALEYIGATACLSCHQNKENFKDSVHGHSLSQAKGIPFERSCETCHGPGSLHAAAAGDRSNPGYASIKIFKGMSAVELEKTCFQCHEDENRTHWVGSVHERRNVSCLACHSVHNAQEAKLLLVKPKIELVCAQCHQDIVAKVKRNAHMPIEEGKMDCTSCHNPHGSATSKMLNQASANETCYTCHADKRGPFLYEHPPVRENCLNCHDPHGTHNEKMLVARLPFLCQRCHITTRHPATPYDLTSINADHNKIMGDACLNCHTNIHGSNHPSGKYYTR